MTHSESTERTPVVIRRCPDGSLVAIFAELPADAEGLFCAAHFQRGWPQHVWYQATLLRTEAVERARTVNDPVIAAFVHEAAANYEVPVRVVDRVTHQMHATRVERAKQHGPCRPRRFCPPQYRPDPWLLLRLSWLRCLLVNTR